MALPPQFTNFIENNGSTLQVRERERDLWISHVIFPINILFFPVD